MVALSSLIILPVFILGLPCSHDVVSHISKSAELYFNALGGAPFLQWSPDMMRGYGHPVLAFYAPIFYWVMAGVHGLGASFEAIFRALSYLALPLAGISMYVLAQRYVSRPAAFVAGLAYLFAPYLLFDAIQRGALPETLALALLPLGLAAVAEAARQPTARSVAPAALLLAVMMSLHNLVPLFTVPLALLVAGLERLDGVAEWNWRACAAAAWRGLFPAGLAIAIAIGATTYIWLPAIIEVRQTLNGQTLPPASPELPLGTRYYENIIPVVDLARWPFEPGDPSLLNAPVSRSLGLIPALLAGLTLLSLFRPSAARRWPVIAGLGVAGLVSLFLSSELSHWLWDHSRTLQIVQLPFRFLGPASLSTALLCGLFVELTAQRLPHGWVRWTIVGAATAIAVCGWPWLYPQYCDLPPINTPAAIAQPWAGSSWAYEPAGELLPEWVQTLPPPNALTDQYKAGQPVNRLVWPAGQVTLLDWQTRRADDRYTLAATQPVTVTYQSFYFPGWQASLDGNPIPMEASSPSGLMVMQLPAGQHRLRVSFQLTPLRAGALIVSVVGGLAWLVVLAAGWRTSPFPRLAMAGRLQTPGGAEGWLLTAIPLVLFGLYFGVVTRASSPIRVERLNGDTLSHVPHPAGISFEGEVRYLGYAAPAQVPADQDINLVQYWKAEHPLGVSYAFAARVADDAGHDWGAKPARPFGYVSYPTTESWPTNRYLRDAFTLHLLPGAPPGRYWLEVNVFRTADSLQLVPAAGTPTSPDPAWARVGQIEVQPPGATAIPVDPSVDVLRSTPLGNGLTLAGWSLPGDQVKPGDMARVTLLWQASQPQASGLQLAASLIDGAGQSLAQFPITPGGAFYPLTGWPSPALVRDQLEWRVPNQLASGSYRLVVQSQQAAADLGHLQVNAPAHQFTVPNAGVVVDHSLGFARLAGFTLSASQARPGDTLSVTLVWQSLTDTSDADRVFVHLRDAVGQPIAQSDAAPAAWQRPTTGWLPGEYITDLHSLTVPPGTPSQTYALVAGLYNPATGVRVGEVNLASVTVP